MTKNIFENAKFGDKFRTRDGKKVIFSTDDITGVYVFYQGMKSAVPYHYDGTPKKTNTSRMLSNIVSEWQEPINEEELEKEASEYALKVYNEQSDNLKIEIASNVLLKNNVTKAYIDGFLRGVEHISVILCNNYDKNIWTKEE